MSRLNRYAALAAIFAASAWAAPPPCLAAATTVAPETAPQQAQRPPQTVPEDTGPGKSGSSSGPLSDKLDRSGGVIHPPSGVDPKMQKSPPPAGPRSTPVIPPPGTPGGDPAVEPK
jgi:hypothetical protein